MKKNEIYEIEIIDIGNNGEGIGKIDDFVVFIPYALKGEIIKTLILKVNKNFAYGKILNIVKQSEFRVEPPCPYFYKCGGCNLQHLQYAKQLEVKKNIVETTLKKQLGEIKVKNCVASNLHYTYRNKMQLPATINGIGMFRENSHDIVEIENCLLCDNWIQTFIKDIKLFIQATNLTLYDEENHRGVLRHILARKVDDNYSFTLVINADKLAKENELIEILSNDFQSFSLFYCVNKIKNNTILTNDIVCLYGNDTQNAVDFEIEYFISPTSFLQVNRYIQNCIYEKIQTLLDGNQIVIDAYSGAGLLSAILSKKAKYVYGIEIVKSATENAEALMKHNNINNVKNINGDCALILPTLVEDLSKNKDNITLVLDPPRKGCDEKVLEAITLAKPNEIFYISCNPSTLARDLKKLTTSYDIEFIEPYDMFPQTKHIETLVRLKLKNDNKKLNNSSYKEDTKNG